MPRSIYRALKIELTENITGWTEHHVVSRKSQKFAVSCQVSYSEIPILNLGPETADPH
jgi:hypothetical protein